MKKILYIGSLTTKKWMHDGERIKTTHIYNVLLKHCDVTSINLSVHKLFNMFRIVWHAIFSKKRFDYVVISKDPHGANIIYKVLNLLKFPTNKIYYFEIGPFLYDRILNGSIKKETFLNGSHIIVETQSMKDDLSTLGFNDVLIFPNFKPLFDNQLKRFDYPKKKLRLIYLSRIESMKGIFDLVDVLTSNKEFSNMYELDCFGMFNKQEEEKQFYKAIENVPYINYRGRISIDSKEAYEKLADYDLHIFPTKYGEGFPGTIIDFFFAGVPTLSSTFARAKDILTNNESYFFEQNNKQELEKMLVYVYNHQDELNTMRESAYKRRYDYSIDKFEGFAVKLLDI